jgi:2,4-dienoyl-CoA reductase-like NADH-dependent reductase (Old Yellow Enzyme family)
MVVWSPFRFNCGREMANRFAIAPLTTNSSHDDGTAAENELEFVRRRAASGFGATISSAAYVEQYGRSWQRIGATRDGHLSSLRRLAEAMRAAGGLAILQIYDGGRIAKPELIGEQCLRAPSPVASLRRGAQTPREMTTDEVGNLIASFRQAASLARKAGFDGVEVHGANHYAVHQFFSPRSNHVLQSIRPLKIIPGDIERRFEQHGHTRIKDPSHGGRSATGQGSKASGEKLHGMKSL